MNGAVCAISGEYVDAVVDLVIPGPEPLTLSRVYTSFSSDRPWSFNHYEQLVLGDVFYEGKPSYLISLYQPTGSKLDYVLEKKENQKKVKEALFKFVKPKGLTNGASLLSGKTNLKNQTLHYFPDKEKVIVQSGMGNQKIFKHADKRTAQGYPICQQLCEEKVNGSRIRYEGNPKGMSGVEHIICENRMTETLFSSLKFKEDETNHQYRQTVLTSDGRKYFYYFDRHRYKVKNKEKNRETSYPVNRFYLTKVDHDHAPVEEYSYKEKSLSQDKHITCKSRDHGKQFLKISYYHTGDNHVGGEIGQVYIGEDDDFRLDRVKKLEAPVGTDGAAVVTHRFDYHIDIDQDKKTGLKKKGKGHTDVYDANNHKTRYQYDEEHRLTAIIHYTGTKSGSYLPYRKECFKWNDEGCLIAKILTDGQNNVHHARRFSYDSHGNVTKSTLCGKLTGKEAPSLQLNKQGELIENGYEKETTTYTYSKEGFNLLLTQTDAAGKTIRYAYESGSDRLQAKYVSYQGKIFLREFYFYDKNHALKKKVFDNGEHASCDDLCYVTERHLTHFSPRKEAPIGLPDNEEEWIEDLFTHEMIPLKYIQNRYSFDGKLEKQKVFDANQKLAYKLEWRYDLHGNLISQTDAAGTTITRKYHKATDNLHQENRPGIEIQNTYDCANRLIEQQERHAEATCITTNRYDLLGNQKASTNCYGHTTHYHHDEFGRITKIEHPQVLHEGSLTTPVEKRSYDIAGYLTSSIDANGHETRYELNIRGQPTQIIYPDGTSEKRLYSRQGWLKQKIARNGTRTAYTHDWMGRVLEEKIDGEEIKTTQFFYNALHLIQEIDPEGNTTHYTYDFAGRLKETIKNEAKTEYFYDSLGRLSEQRDHYGEAPGQYRATITRYDPLDRIIEERIQAADETLLQESRYAYDVRGNLILHQTGDHQVKTDYNSRNQPVKITDNLSHETSISYDIDFINQEGQKVLQKKTTDPLGIQTVDTYDAASRLVESVRLNRMGEKIARQHFSYDLAGNLTTREEEVIEDQQLIRLITTLFSYNTLNELTQTVEAAGTAEQKSSSIIYNDHGEQEALIKPDGNTLHYTYDGFGRLKTSTSSDHSIDYLYTYNLLDEVISILDRVTGKRTTREYFDGHLKKETLSNGLSIAYSQNIIN